MADEHRLATPASHPLRTRLTEEMHLRKFPPLKAPAQILQLLVMTGDAEGTARAIAHLGELTGGPALPVDLRYHRFRHGDVDVIWERHTEFASYSFIRAGAADPLFSLAPFAGIDAEWLRTIPGEVMRATRLVLVGAADAPPEPAILAQFSTHDLVCCDVADGAARLYSDFRLHPESTGRLLIVDRDLQGVEAAQLVQRVQELGGYRKIALLGLPAAQGAAATLAQLESRLADLAEAVAAEGSEAPALLKELSALSAELAALTEATRFRMSASAAYGRLVQDRLAALRVQPVRGFLALGDFTERRLLPALRTCASFSERLDDLARRAEWTSALLRTRIDTALAAQNRDLLASMNRRARAQLHLQQTVEGLSVVAISYYAVGLFAYLVKPLHGPDWLVAAAVPPILLVLWLALRRLRARWAE